MSDVILSKEYLDKIRGFSAIRPDETFVYVPKVYRDFPEDLRAKFTLRPATGEESAKLADMMRGEISMENGKTTVAMKRGEFIIAACRKGIVRWDNYYDETGRMVAFDKSIENIPYKLLEELASAIVGRSSLTEEELLGLK